MNQPYIRNHQYNFIKRHVGILEQACRTAADPKVVESVRYSTITKIMELFPDLTDEQKQRFEEIEGLQTAEQFHKYLSSLEPYMTSFPQVTEKQIMKLFPKNKKLKLPDLQSIDYRYATYLGWIDISTNKLFIVYPYHGQTVGIEGKFSPTNKKGYCFLCNRSSDVTLFTATTKSRPANASPDYYKAIGNYLCINSHECNRNITDTASLEAFIQNVIG